MNRIAFVLIHCESGQEIPVRAALDDIEEVTEIHGIFGEFDLMAKVETEEGDDVTRVVSNRIRAIPGIHHTETLLATDPWGPED